MELKMQVTNVLERNLTATKKIVVNQGGTGSSKTYSLAQLFILLGLNNTGQTFSIVRQSMPTLRATAMRDFFNILKGYDLYDENQHDKTNNLYTLNGNLYEFFGLDEPQKVRSRRRDYAWLNEGNEFSLEAYRQMMLRTNKRMFLDFNPSDQYHWIYDEVLPRKDCEVIISTYRDNPFLPKTVVQEIESFKNHDPNYWKVYGLGQKGSSQVTIYTHWQLCDVLPQGGDRFYGLDFGYNHPTALVEVVMKDNEIYSREVIYESYLTNQQRIQKMNDLGISKTDEIFADPEDPSAIEEISQAGYNIKPAKKGAGSVKKGIDDIKSRAFHITKDSANGQKELKSYSWKTKKDGKILDEPVKVKDDFCDALRMAIFTRLNGELEAEIYL